MAVLVEGYSVLCRLETLQDGFHGGIAAYEHAIPNATYCKDAQLCRVGFAHESDVQEWLNFCELRSRTRALPRRGAEEALVEGLVSSYRWSAIT